MGAVFGGDHHAVRGDEEICGQPEPATGLSACRGAEPPAHRQQAAADDGRPAAGIEQCPGTGFDSELPVDLLARIGDGGERQIRCVLGQFGCGEWKKTTSRIPAALISACRATNERRCRLQIGHPANRLNCRCTRPCGSGTGMCSPVTLRNWCGGTVAGGSGWGTVPPCWRAVYAYGLKAIGVRCTLSIVMPRPRSLSQTQLAAAALAVVDADGLEGLSMRAVARRLGLGTMSLYRYVADRDELEALVVDLVLGEIEPGPPRGSARQQLTELAERVRVAAARHPAVVPLLLTHRHRSPASLRWGKWCWVCSPPPAMAANAGCMRFRAVLAYIFGAIEIEMLGSLTGPGTRTLAGLPADEYPLLSETAAVAHGIRPDEEFRRGLEILLRALDL